MASSQDIRAGRAFVELYVDRNPLVRGLNLASRDIAKWGAAISSAGKTVLAAGSAILAPILATTKVFADTGHDLMQMSKRTGVSVEALSQLGYAAELSGVNVEDFEGSIRKMQRAIYDAATSGGDAGKAFKTLGLDVNALVNAAPDQQLEAMADALSAIPNPTERAAVAMKVFGRGGTAMLPMLAEGADRIRRFRQEAADLGLTKSTKDAQAGERLAEAMKVLWKTVKGLTNAVDGALAPVLTDVYQRMARVVASAAGWIKHNQAVVQAVAALGLGLMGAGVALITFGKGLGDCTQLVSADSGAARILSVESGTGTKWGYVRIGAGGGGGSSYPACTVICAEAIPANSLARIVSYNRHSDTYLVAKPEADDLPLSQLVWIPDAVPANTPGTGMLDFGAAPLLTDDNVKQGDTVGSRANSWKARKGRVGLEVAAVITGTLSYVNILDGGSNYLVPPTITFSGSSASRQATAITKVTDGKLSAVIILDSGADYTAAPTASITGNARVEPVMVTALDSLTLSDGGAGYDKAHPPAVTIANTGTALGTATAAVGDDGKVSKLTITSRGFGFFDAPAVTIAPPPGYPGTGKAIATAKAAVA